MLRPPLGKCTEDGDNCITSVQNAGDDVLIHYRDAPPSLVMLYSSGARAAGARLGTSALAGDPRVYLDPEIHPDSKFDPSHRTAVIIDPEPSLEQPGALANMVSTLKKRDYEVTELDGTQASIERIAGALESSPGVVIFSTHGNTLGQLLVGNTVTVSDESMEVAYAQYAKQLTAEGLGTLASYELPDGTPAYLLGQSNCSFKIFQLSTVCQWKVVITPGFWAWLTAERHVNWSSSLVFISACETDLKPPAAGPDQGQGLFRLQPGRGCHFCHRCGGVPAGLPGPPDPLAGGGLLQPGTARQDQRDDLQGGPPPQRAPWATRFGREHCHL